MNSTTPDLGSLIIFYIIALIIFGIPSYVIYWKLFNKAGQAGWKYIIPFYSQYIMGVIAKRPKVGLTATIALALYYISTIPALKLSLITPVLALVYVIFGLACLTLFIQKYDAGIGKWILFLFFPYIGVFFVNSVKYKGDGVPPQTPNTPAAPTQPAESAMAAPSTNPPTSPAQSTAPTQAPNQSVNDDGSTPSSNPS